MSCWFGWIAPFSTSTHTDGGTLAGNAAKAAPSGPVCCGEPGGTSSFIGTHTGPLKFD
jgi:hypothetical protein